jgi:uncharacterized membrane protein YdbT with pleckstrin-like domain
MAVSSQGAPVVAKMLGAGGVGGGSDSTSALAEEELVNVITARDRNGPAHAWMPSQSRQQQHPEDDGNEGVRRRGRRRGDEGEGGEADGKDRDSHSHSGMEPELLTHVKRIEALEYASDVFGSSVALRSDTIGLFKTMASSLAVILAFKHTSKLTKANQIGLYVAAVLLFCVYIVSQLTYYIAHWLKWTNMQKRNVARSYTSEGPERSEQEEQRDAVATLWNIRVAEGELLAGFTRDVIVLANTYIAFILVAVLLDQINANFADGQFIFEKLVELVVIVLIVFAFFACISYRRDSLLKPYRL